MSWMYDELERRTYNADGEPIYEHVFMFHNGSTIKALRSEENIRQDAEFKIDPDSSKIDKMIEEFE